VTIFSRFFGQSDKDDRVTQLIANPLIERPLGLEVLLDGPLDLTSEKLTQALRAFHPSMEDARSEIDPKLQANGSVFGLAGWHKHVVKLVGFNVPMPAEVVEANVAPAHYDQELKACARAHASHVILYYSGYDDSPLEQYVALAMLAAVIAQFGGIILINESAHTSFPAQTLATKSFDGDILELLRSLPLLALYCGFVKYEVEGTEGVWMRTYGANSFGLPDLAILADGHHQGELYFEMFGTILDYLRDSGATFAAGHTMQLGDDAFMRLRDPTEDEYFLDSDGELFVAEIVGPEDMNG
jgi:hypothetical protein